MSLHPMPSSERIFDSCSESVSQVKRSRNVRRRNDHDELFLVGLVHGQLWGSLVESGSFPPILPSGFNGGGMVRIGHGNGGEVFLVSLWRFVDECLFGKLWFLLFLVLWLSPLWLFLLLLVLAFGHFLELILGEFLGLIGGWCRESRSLGHVACEFCEAFIGLPTRRRHGVRLFRCSAEKMSDRRRREKQVLGRYLCKPNQRQKSFRLLAFLSREIFPVTPCQQFDRRIVLSL